jgi:hypothetical protein
MLYSKLKIYLKTNIDKPSIDFKWSNEDNKKLFFYLNDHYPDISFSDTQNQQKVKQAFKEHFESVGYILFKMSETQLRIKVFAYRIEPKDSVNLDEILDIIDDNEDLIEYNYNGKKDLICIQKELTLKLSHFANKITNEEINKKELLKYAVREAFELYESDIVIIKNNQIFIKMFDYGSMREVSEDEKNTIANRYNGINEHELKSFYDNFFLKEENKNFFYSVAEQFVDIYLLEKKIDNVIYEKYAFSFIQSIITERLISSFDHNDEFFKGFSGYVFRIHFKEVFGYISYLILSEISSSNRYVMDFLKYYSLDVVVLNGKKYKVPMIEASNGLKWSVSSMISIVKIYIKTEISLDKILEKIYNLEEELLDLYIGNRSPLDYNKAFTKEIEKLTKDISYNMGRLNSCLDLLNSSKNEKDIATLKTDIAAMKRDLQYQKDEKIRLTSKLVAKDIIIKYTNLKREMDSLIRQEKRDEKILAQNKDSYLSIKNSLVKALTSKKVLLEEIAS